MAIEKYIIDKSDLTALLRGEDLKIQPKGNIKGFCVEIAGNLTNGDMIKAMFPSVEVKEKNNGYEVYFGIGTAIQYFNYQWWNAPYKADKRKTMTREEAIKQLNKLKSFHNGSYGEAINFAIESIKVDMAYDFEFEKVESKACEKNLRWIPVSEELPKEDGEYLLWGKIDEDEENYIFIGEYDSCGEQFGIWQEQFDRTTLGCLGSEFFEYSSVIAWQPLPQPYEESEEKE